MTLEIWLTFTLACVVLTLIPGPSVLLVVAQALATRLSDTFMCIVGIMIGSLVLMALSFAGVGVILSTSTSLFQAVKWAGVIYLAYLGICQVRDARKGTNPIVDGKEVKKIKSLLGSLFVGIVTAILNPKAIVFYLAFFTQFIDPKLDLPFQVALLMTTSTLVTGILLFIYAFIAAQTQRALKSENASRIVGYAGGGLMLFGSTLMATTR